MMEKEQQFSADDAEFATLLAQVEGWKDNDASHPTGEEEAPTPLPARGRSSRRAPHPGRAAGEPRDPRPRQETERGTWLGYVGRYAPEFTRLPSGRLRGQFWLGEHDDPNDLDTATWHRVYCLDRHAESLRKKALTRGMLVQVTGTLQVSEKPQADGTLKRTESIYCYGVRIMGGEVKPPRG